MRVTRSASGVKLHASASATASRHTSASARRPGPTPARATCRARTPARSTRAAAVARGRPAVRYRRDARSRKARGACERLEAAAAPFGSASIAWRIVPARPDRGRDGGSLGAQRARASNCRGIRASRVRSAAPAARLEGEVAFGVHAHRAVAEVRRADAQPFVVDDHHLRVQVDAGALGEPLDVRDSRRGSGRAVGLAQLAHEPRAQRRMVTSSSQPWLSSRVTSTISGPSGSREPRLERVARSPWR